MNILDSKAYRALEFFYELLILNLLWLVASMPIVTFYPATTAMFSVVRDRLREKEPGLVGSFFSFLKMNFKQSLWIGIVWMLLGGLLVLDLYLVGRMPLALKLPMLLLLSLLGILYVFSSTYLFPVMANYDLSWTKVLRNSLLFSVSQLPTTIQCLLILVAAAAIFQLFHASLLILGSVTAYLIYLLCDKSFRRVEKLESIEKR